MRAASAVRGFTLACLVLCGCSDSAEHGQPQTGPTQAAPARRDRNAAEVNAELGRHYFDDGNFDAAVEYLETAVALGADDDRTRSQLSRARCLLAGAPRTREEIRPQDRTTMRIGECVMQASRCEVWTGLERDELRLKRAIEARYSLSRSELFWAIYQLKTIGQHVKSIRNPIW